jgi:hypothetical membrane protein
METEPGLVARWCAIVAAALTLIVTVAGAAVTPGYSHLTHYISELGQRGTTVGALVSYGGFLPIGVAALAALVLGLGMRSIESSLRSSAKWLLTLPAAYLVAAFARCTAGCAGVDLAQALHNLFGLAEYLGGAVALIVAGVASLARRRFGRGLLLLVLSLVVLACLSNMFSPGSSYHGACQRVAEAILFGFLIFLVWRAAPNGTTPAPGHLA